MITFPQEKLEGMPTELDPPRIGLVQPLPRLVGLGQKTQSAVACCTWWQKRPPEDRLGESE